MNILKCAMLSMALFLTGCAGTGATFMEPSTNTPYATIHGEGGFAASRRFTIDAIDGQSIGMVWSQNSIIRVAPGPHKVSASFEFIQYKLFGDSGQQNELSLEFDAKAGENYKLAGTVQGERIYGWVVDSRGRLAGPKTMRVYLPLNATAVHVPDMDR